MDDIPRAQVTERDGEVSCSVEETNRIRAALGLKPLEVGGGGTTSSRTEVDARVDRAQLKQQEDLRARIERSRTERQKALEQSAKGLGEVLKAQSLSAADWVALSRQKGATAAAPTAFRSGGAGQPPRARAPQARGASGGDADLVVNHSAEDFAAGEAAILTLRDRSLLDASGDDLAGGDDVLVNVDRAERERAAELAERRKRAKLPVYDGLDDEEFGPGGGGGSRKMLRQYDEDDVGEGSSGSGGLVIRAGGGVEDVAATRRAEVLKAVGAGRSAVDVSAAGLVSGAVASDYYTEAELAARRKGGGGKKGKKQLRKTGSSADAGDEAAPADAAGAAMPGSGSVTAAILAQVATAAVSTERDRGSRASRGGATAAQTDAERTRLLASAAAFDSAVARATDKAAVLLADPSAASAATASTAAASLQVKADPTQPVAAAAATATLLPPVPASNLNAATKQRAYARLRDAGGLGDSDDDDSELVAVLSRARRLAQQRAATTTSAPEAAVTAEHEAEHMSDRAASFVAHAVKSTHHAAAGSAATAAEAGGPEGGGIVFNALSEFSSLLQARVSEQHSQATTRAESAAAGRSDAGAAAVAAAAPPAEGLQLEAAAAGRKRRRGHSADGAEGAPAPAAWVEGGDGSGAGELDAGGSSGGGSGGGDDAAGRSDEEEEDDDDEEEVEVGFGRDVGMGRGAAAALGLFARGGALQQKTTFVGRSKDGYVDYTAADTVVEAGPAAGRQIVLEYKDAQGNLLTTKQAYRELCYRFHGRKPSQKTRDKRMKQNAREQKLLHAPTADTPLGSLSALQRAQEARGAAGLLMSHGR